MPDLCSATILVATNTQINCVTAPYPILARISILVPGDRVSKLNKAIARKEIKVDRIFQLISLLDWIAT